MFFFLFFTSFFHHTKSKQTNVLCVISLHPPPSSSRCENNLYSISHPSDQSDHTHAIVCPHPSSLCPPLVMRFVVSAVTFAPRPHSAWRFGAPSATVSAQSPGFASPTFRPSALAQSPVLSASRTPTVLPPTFGVPSVNKKIRIKKNIFSRNVHGPHIKAKCLSLAKNYQQKKFFNFFFTFRLLSRSLTRS